MKKMTEAEFDKRYNRCPYCEWYSQQGPFCTSCKWRFKYIDGFDNFKPTERYYKVVNAKFKE